MRTSHADKNVLNWSGDTLQWYLGTDDAQPCDKVPSVVYPSDPMQWDSALKVSGNISPVRVGGIAAAQCRENVLDINHSHDVTFANTQFGRPGEVGQQVITIKGGSGDIKLSGVIYSRGLNADVVLDCWSDQSREVVHDIDLEDLSRVDGKPLRVILGRGRRDGLLLPPNARILLLKSAGYTIYWWLKLAAVKVRLIR